MKCPFCDIEENKTKILYSGKHVYVCLSNPRLMPGHILVIPKRHVMILKDLKPAERTELWETVDKFCIKILKFSRGYTIKNNFMPFLPDSKLKVTHLHIHIWPRNLDDDLYKKVLYNDKLLWKDLAEKEITEIKNKMK